MLWSTEFIDKLPDSSFAYISPGGQKDSDGKTSPRSLRHLPYKDADGKPNEAHVRDALSRLSQTQIPASAKEEAFGKLNSAAKELGITVDEKRKFSDLQPLKIPVGRIGEWKHPQYGTIKMSQRMFDEMKRNFKEKTIGRDPFVRIGHDKGTANTWGDAPSEAWVQDLQQEGDTLYALADPTNPQVVEAVRNKRFRYASPEYDENYRSKEDGSFKGAVLHAIALTNEPFLTRLPEARLLADPPDTLYLDFEEVSTGMEDMKQLLEQQKETNGFLRKLADFFTGKKPEDITGAGGATTPTPTATQTEEQKKLADQMATMQQELASARQAQRTAEVEARLQGYIQAGIPPAVLDNYRPILLADSGEKTIKLADDKMISLSEQIYSALDAFPDNARVKFSQVGTSQQPPQPGSPEEIKKLADQDMRDLGYTVDEQGHYKLV